MQVLGYDPFLDDEQLKEAGCEARFTGEIYAQADFISLHVPLNQETREPD
jgi:phosphoglycerate dehydrogenase-like enzyme